MRTPALLAGLFGTLLAVGATHAVIAAAALFDMRAAGPPATASLGRVGAAAAAGACSGDCDGDGRVTIDELMAGIGIALGDVGNLQCAAAFCNAECGPGPAVVHVAVSCIVGAVARALDGCPADPCRDDADCDDGNGCTADQCTSEGCVSACLCV